MDLDSKFSLPSDAPPPIPPEDYSRRVRVRFIFAAFICSITTVILIFLFSPFFYVETVIVNGNFRVSQQEINDFLEINEKTHLLLYNTRAAKKRFLQNTYVENVEFERVLPGRLYVNVEERRLTAFFEHSVGSFLFLDDFGRVLEVKTFFTEPLPILVGLQFTRFQIGEVLEVPDSAAFNVIVQYAQLLNQHGLIEKVSHINVNDSANIRIIVRNKEFNVGGVANADEKIRTIAAVLETMPNADLIPGFMDLREVRKEYFFEISH
ncbi:MAG: FtsQ-type POTRA domain-containing protein [Defluviitaleaceae bacterium]|nr:FtsQ-type POTRA domain-containing protein [Defluviitaleaceae bacterium]